MTRASKLLQNSRSITAGELMRRVSQQAQPTAPAHQQNPSSVNAMHRQSTHKDNTKTPRNGANAHQAHLPFAKQRADLDKLPIPADFYAQMGLTLKGGGLWRLALCPFHNDKRPSLSINSQHGGYICHTCGAHGDMLAFYMNVRGVDFVQACKDWHLYD